MNLRWKFLNLYTGKKSQVWKTTNFDAGLYDITGFLWALIISIYLGSSMISIN